MPSENQSSQLAELARHWQAATSPTNLSKAIDYSRRAGDAAREAVALVDAARWYGQALELAERDPSTDPELRCRLLLSLGAAQLPADPAHGRVTLKQAGSLAEQIGDRELLVACALSRLSSWQTSESADPEVLRLTRRALAGLGDGTPAVRARLLAALAEETDPSEWVQRRELADAARLAADEAGDDAATVEVFLMTSFTMSANDAAYEYALTERVVGLAEQSRNPAVLAGALSFRNSASMTVGDLSSARQAVGRLRTLADSYAFPPIQVSLATNRAMLCMLQGDLASLELEADVMLALSTRVPTALPSYGGCLFELRWAQGRLGEFAAMFSEAASELRSYAGFRPALVVTCLEAGDLDQARSVFADDATDRFESYPHDMVWLSCMALFAEAAIRLEDRDAASALHEKLSPYGDLHCCGAPIYYGLADRMIGNLAGFLGRPDEAESRLRHALGEHRKIGAHLWTARTALDLAELLHRRGVGPIGGAQISGPSIGSWANLATEAAGLLDEAGRLAEAGGYGPVARRVAELRANDA